MPNAPSTLAGLDLCLIGHGIPALLGKLSLLALCVSKRDPRRDGKGDIGNVLAQSRDHCTDYLNQRVEVMLEVFYSCLAMGLVSGRPSFCQWRQFITFLLLYLRSKRVEIKLKRIVPPLVSILTAILDSRVMTHVIRVMKEEKIEKACWKVGKVLLVRAYVVLLDQDPSSSAKLLV